VTTNNMMTVARAGVLDHTIPAKNDVSPSALIARAAATASINTSTVKMAALLGMLSGQVRLRCP
jgi:hypothetical protein